MAAVLGSSSLPCRAQQSFDITFDEYPFQPRGTSYYVREYSEFPLWFRPLGVVGPGNGFSHRGGGLWGFPENGTAYLAAAFGDSLAFSFVDNVCCFDSTTFNLVSVDLAEYSTVVPNAVTVPFIGYRDDGSTVTTSFTTDGIIDGTGPLADFQTFYFGPEFSGLTRVEIPTYGWSLDNLVIAIPEPSTGLLLVAGGVAFWSLRQYRRCAARRS